MSLSFVQPGYLWLLLLLPLVWLVPFAAPWRGAPWRRWLSLALRSAMLVALVLALAGAQLATGARQTTTVFVVDNSDSVAPATRAQADTYIQSALHRMPEGDRAAIVIFGAEAVVERPPSEQREFVRSTLAPPSDQTDIGRALQLALALLPGETRKRVVLLSDGAETRGRALDAADLARASGVPIETVSLLGPPAAEDVALEILQAPARAREGQSVGLTVQVRSGRKTPAQLVVSLNRQRILETAVQLETGLNRIPLTVPSPGPGFHAWEVRVVAPGDTLGANNVQFGFTEVRGQPRVLLVEGAPGRAANLEAALRSARLNPVVVAPNGLPTSLIGMDVYDVIVLADVPYRSLPERAAQLLPAYVRELGRGLLMVGGEDSYAAGGYRDTPIEAALPVTMRTRGVKVQPDVALVLVIDESGSMDGQKLSLAKEGAAQAYATLDERDQIGVIAFDTAASWAVRLQKKPAAETFLNDLGSIGGGGGTDLRPGLEAAAEALERAEAKIKHVVLLSDGQADRNYDDVVQRMKKAGITLSTVGIDDYDPHLKDIAPETGGRFYEVQNFNDVPRLFFDESLRIARRGIVEKEFSPVITFPAPVVRDLAEAPPLLGYNAVTPKDTAQVMLESDEDDPILAQWQYGLGRAAAWTPDMKGQWAKHWIAWDGFGRFAARLVGGLLPAPSPQGFETTVGVEGTALAVELRAEQLDGRPRSGLGATGRIIGADGRVQEVPLFEVEPGRYRGTTALPAAGVYQAQVLIKAGDGAILGIASSGAVVPPSSEYVQRDGNLALLTALAERTGGRLDLPAEQVWNRPSAPTRQTVPLTWQLLWLAALLWPVDIAVRRLLQPRPQAVERWLRARTARRPEPKPAKLPQQRARIKQTASSSPAEPAGTQPSPPPSAASGAAPSTSPYDWRRSRRSVVERPAESGSRKQ